MEAWLLNTLVCKNKQKKKWQTPSISLKKVFSPLSLPLSIVIPNPDEALSNCEKAGAVGMKYPS